MLGLPSCKEVSEQSSAALDEPLSFGKKLARKLHLMMCEQCRRYSEKIYLTKQSILFWAEGKSMPETIKQQCLDDFEKHHCQHKNDS